MCVFSRTPPDYRIKAATEAADTLRLRWWRLASIMASWRLLFLSPGHQREHEIGLPAVAFLYLCHHFQQEVGGSLKQLYARQTLEDIMHFLVCWTCIIQTNWYFLGEQWTSLHVTCCSAYLERCVLRPSPSKTHHRRRTLSTAHDVIKTG